MKKTEIIETTIINQAVEIEHINGDVARGYLVQHPLQTKSYLLLPFDYTAPKTTYLVSHIKHIKFLLNGYKIW